MNHNTISTPNSLDLANDDQIRARLLYPYVINNAMSFMEYESSLRQIAVDLDSSLMEYRVSEDCRGELSLNIKLATHFVMSVSSFPKGTVARVLLDEAYGEAGSGDPDCINRLLETYWKVGIIPSHVQAETLHGFLGCEMAFDDWFFAQKKRQCLACKLDYVRVTRSEAAPPKIHERDDGEGEIYLMHDAAKRLITATPTQRGKLASTYLQEPVMQDWLM